MKSRKASPSTKSTIPRRSETARVDRKHRGRSDARTKRLASRGQIPVAYSTALGEMLVARVEEALDSKKIQSLRGKIDLIFTSPPFPLVRKKEYGNKDGDEYLRWLQRLSNRLAALLSPTGSIVVEIGNAWEAGSPVMSTLPLKALLAFQEAGNLKLCQHIICHNPARLPSPAEWVNIHRIRLKDSFTHVWWMSKVDFPKADNRKVLVPYSEHMKRLLRSKVYNSGRRPSGHVISKKGFLQDHGGAIAAGLFDLDENDPRLPMSVVKFSNTSWDAGYVTYCRENNLPLHPARMRPELVGFFIELLTDAGDMVMDPFGGSNTTGAVAEVMGRKWLSIEASVDYANGSKGRFV
jgi:site-specific DNA-methyltransferase (cytosine-N4-specific)